VRITVHRTQPGFEGRAVRVSDGPFADAEADNTYVIDVAAQNARLDADAHAATGALVISSNDRREPRKEVPLFLEWMAKASHRPRRVRDRRCGGVPATRPDRCRWAGGFWALYAIAPASPRHPPCASARRARRGRSLARRGLWHSRWSSNGRSGHGRGTRRARRATLRA
jgi:hypothetical protein